MSSDLRVLVRAGLMLAAIVAIMPTTAHGQATNGTLLGTVTDSSGAGVPGVTVNITETRTNISTSTLTKAPGFYTFPNLKDGLYRVEAELSGFKKAVRDKVQVDVNTTMRVDLKLDLGTL